MKKVRISVLRKTEYPELMEAYENPSLEAPCSVQVGQVFLCNGWQQPEGFCQSAWDTLSPFVMALSCGAKGIYGNWMKNPRSAMLSCNDGFRPVTFFLEALDEDAD